MYPDTARHTAFAAIAGLHSVSSGMVSEQVYGETWTQRSTWACGLLKQGPQSEAEYAYSHHSNTYAP